MGAVKFISDCLAEVHLRLMAICGNLTNDELLWPPAPTSNNIGFIVWHLARGEDARIADTGKLDENIWATELRYNRFGQPITAPDPGDRMGLRALAIPSSEMLVGYAESARRRTLKYPSGLSDSGLDQAPDPDRPDLAVASSLRHLATHKNNHHGQIDYLRGLQDEAWDLPGHRNSALPALIHAD